MPKLLLVGIVEKTCLKTVVREIPGITDCFKSKEDKDGETIYRVGPHTAADVLGSLHSTVDYERFKYSGPLAVRLQ